MTNEERIELKEKQLLFESEIFGDVWFQEYNGSSYKACKKCLLFRIPSECHKAACSSFFRVDLKNGYYTIQQTPN